jgi:hypothetical protein
MSRLRVLFAGVLPLAALLVLLLLALRLRRRWGVSPALLARYPEFGGWPLLGVVALAFWTVLRGLAAATGLVPAAGAWRVAVHVVLLAPSAWLAWLLTRGRPQGRR